MVLGRRVLVLYAYHESPSARENVLFFLRRGLLPAESGDHVFVLQGAHTLEAALFDRSNVAVLERENRCFDFGAWAAGLATVSKTYEVYVLMNASVRGPFLPSYERRPWWDVFADELGGPQNVGLVGTSLNCWTSLEDTHLQSMFLVTHRRGLELLARDDDASSLLGGCAASHEEAVFEHEIPTSQAFLRQNYSLKTTLTAFARTLPEEGGVVTPAAVFPPYDAAARTRLKELCLAARQGNAHAGDPYYPGEYGGGDVHPFEAVFFKANRAVAASDLDRYTRWLLPDDDHATCRPQPSYVAVIFSSQRGAGFDADYADVANAMVDLAKDQDGYLGVESTRAPDGFGITVSYWRDELAVAQWKHHARHVLARDRGRADFYDNYILRVANVHREYAWNRTSP
mmetsp:Transcript_18584/g.57131  ORF Transcript_18584/g.57131 Transcript_18584/m.57131 type:complete len:400 (+) Transcript_18584:34-1233(+)